MSATSYKIYARPLVGGNAVLEATGHLSPSVCHWFIIVRFSDGSSKGYEWPAYVDTVADGEGARWAPLSATIKSETTIPAGLLTTRTDVTADLCREGGKDLPNCHCILVEEGTCTGNKGKADGDAFANEWQRAVSYQLVASTLNNLFSKANTGSPQWHAWMPACGRGNCQNFCEYLAAYIKS
eukprot:TRINITY_DN46056_c0_g1_i1.p1 TRINITY_DN46056_c0_g1~~TRINITY_DN46056_c0_g1_i1.p1  ORF type:complete len:182 (+),score=23.09 TRINITY_DN46056_c0_g1_i1:64-609(+)